jgi:hypothetical protein
VVERDVEEVDEGVGALLVVGPRVLVRDRRDERVDAGREERAALGVEHPGDAVHAGERLPHREPARVEALLGGALERVRRDGRDPAPGDDGEPAGVEPASGDGEERVARRDGRRRQRPGRRCRDPQVTGRDGTLRERRAERRETLQRPAKRDEGPRVALREAQRRAEPALGRRRTEAVGRVAGLEHAYGRRLRCLRPADDRLQGGDVVAETHVVQRRRIDVHGLAHRGHLPFSTGTLGGGCDRNRWDATTSGRL